MCVSVRRSVPQSARGRVGFLDPHRWIANLAIQLYESRLPASTVVGVHEPHAIEHSRGEDRCVGSPFEAMLTANSSS